MKNRQRDGKRYDFDVVVKSEAGVESTLKFDILLFTKKDELWWESFKDWCRHGIMDVSFQHAKFARIPGTLVSKGHVHLEEKKHAKDSKL